MPDTSKHVKFNVGPDPAAETVVSWRKCKHDVERDTCHQCFVEYELDYLINAYLLSTLSTTDNKNKRIRDDASSE